MATLNEIYTLSKNSHLLNRVSAALADAAEDIRNEQQDFTVDISTDIFTATGHNYIDGDKVELFGDFLPTGVAENVTYFIRDQAANVFSLAEIAGGAVIDLTATGHGSIAVEHHSDRFTWATTVLVAPDGSRDEAVRSIWMVLQNTLVADEYQANPLDGGSTLLDSDVQFVVNGIINFLAGVET